MYSVAIKTCSPRRVAGVLHLGAYPDIAEAFERLGGIVAAQNLFPHVQAMIGVYHDAPGSKPEAQFRSHAAFEISENFPRGIDGLDYFDVAGGKYAVMEHKGRMRLCRARMNGSTRNGCRNRANKCALRRRLNFT